MQYREMTEEERAAKAKQIGVSQIWIDHCPNLRRVPQTDSPHSSTYLQEFIIHPTVPKTVTRVV